MTLGATIATTNRIGVVWRNGMPLNARVCVIGADLGVIATQDIDPIGNGFEMFGVHARTVAAKVVNHKPFGDGSFVQLIRESVSDDTLSSATAQR